MALFQKSVLKKYLNDLDKEQLQQAWQLFKNHFHNPGVQKHIRDSKEEEYQEGFVRDLFVKVLGYTLKPQPDYNFVLEKKTEADATKSDGAILKGETVIAVVELKDTEITELDKIEKQVFGYKNKHKSCVYVITSNFEKLRLYINDAIESEDFDLFNLTESQFSLLYLCLHQQHIEKDIPLEMKQASLAEEETVTNKLYADYSYFKQQLFTSIASSNSQFDKLELFKKTQKLLDRFLFILFAEDRLLLPPNSVRDILKQWEQLKELDNYVPLYDRFKKYFGYLNTGYEGKQHEIFAYNGGLFAGDHILDNIYIDDKILFEGTKQLSSYDFETEVDVNILGHIFEHSLAQIEEVQAELEGKPVEKTKTKRKKDGVFYTPRYITKYIVENTVRELCQKKKEEAGIVEEIYIARKFKTGEAEEKRKRKLLETLNTYRQWLFQITICDPACGSGAFLNQALEFLIAEHRYIDELKAKLFGDAFVLSDVETTILENNLFGVDINEEAVEIARLSLWLRTARKGRKLNDLSKNIKCGNSLIDDPLVAGDKAFNWHKEFPQIFGPFKETKSTQSDLYRTQQPTAVETKEPVVEIDSSDTENRESLTANRERIVNTDYRITNEDHRIVNEPEPFYGNKKHQKKGFDVVIGNPPYVDIKGLPEDIVDYIFKNFESANNRLNLFSIFIERAFTILKTNGGFSFIIPSSLLTQESYKKSRELLVKQTELKSIVRLPNESFGGSAGDVKVDTIILTFKFKKPADNNVELIIYKGFDRITQISSLDANTNAFVNQASWFNDKDYTFRINVTDSIQELLNKIETDSVKLSDCADFSLGLTPYDKYRGHTKEQIETQAFHASFKKDETYKKLLAGNDVKRYNVEWNGEEWISYGPWLGALREQKFFQEKRILVKQIIDWSSKRIWAALAEDEYYNTQNAFNILPHEDFLPEYIIGAE